MSEARAAKVAVVDEVRERFSDSDSLVLTEYRLSLIHISEPTRPY